jgi:CheY-like chemotaxis protein
MAKILVADDEVNIAEMAKGILTEFGHDVDIVHDGQSALLRLQTKTYDVALIDVKMPLMDGYHLAAEAQGLQHPPKIVIATARDYDNDQAAVKAVGVSAFLHKPFSNKDLVEVVERLALEKKKAR